MRNLRHRGLECFCSMRFAACVLLLCSSRLIAQESSCTSIQQVGDGVVLTATAWDPVLAISDVLARQYGVKVSVEDPAWDFPHDTEDVAVAHPNFSETHNHAHYLVMKRHVVQVRFPAKGASITEDIPALLHQVADAANKEMPYSYRVDVSGRDFDLVATTTQDAEGRVKGVEPLLDRHVTIPYAKRSLAEHARMVADQLSQQTGLHVICCEAFVFTGIRWGASEVPFAADDKPAREVLKALIQLSLEAGEPRVPDRWTVACDGTGAPWCFISFAAFSNGC